FVRAHHRGQGWQHQAIAAQGHDEIGLGQSALAIARAQLCRRLVRSIRIIGYKADPDRTGQNALPTQAMPWHAKSLRAILRRWAPRWTLCSPARCNNCPEAASCYTQYRLGRAKPSWPGPAEQRLAQEKSRCWKIPRPDQLFFLAGKPNSSSREA